MNKLCCEEFRWRYTASTGMGLNIRVANLIVDGKLGDVGFFITEGYTSSSKGIKFCKINYCPYCGTKLSKLVGKNKDLVNSNIKDFTKI